MCWVNVLVSANLGKLIGVKGAVWRGSYQGGRSRFFANGIIFVLRAYKNNKISANDRKLG